MAKISRRDFFKLGAAAGAMLALSEGVQMLPGSGAAIAAEETVSRTTGRRGSGVPSTCQLCPARCGIIGFVDEGRIVKIEGNPRHPNNQGTICAKGIAAVNLVYNPDRLLYPLKRAGARGEGKWQRITWEEALDELSLRLRELREQKRPEEFVLQAGTAVSSPLLDRFLRAYGTPNALTWSPAGGENRATAWKLTWGAPFEISDVAHAKYILNFGSNPYESHLFHLPLVRRLIQGRTDNHAKLVTFDVRLSATAGRSDEWIPLKPGTDGIVALAMAQVIMSEGLFDQDFLDKWANYPVADLTRYLARYTPEKAEEISGVAASDIRRIAREFATTKPAATLSGTGVSMHRNGFYNERCIALLSAITGNIDIPGGVCLPREYRFEEPEPQPPEPEHKAPLSYLPQAPFSPHVPLHTEMQLLKEGKQRVGVYMTYMRNPAYSNPHTTLSAAVLKDEELIPYFVAVDIALSESTAFADLVLPDATFLERWGLEPGPAFGLVPFVALRQPVVAPRGESRPFDEVLLELARRIGGGMEEYFAFNTVESYLKSIVDKIEPLAQAGGMDYLKKFGVWSAPDASPDYRSYERGGFPTSSGKFEIFSPALAQQGLPPLPCFEMIPEHQNLGEEEFILVTFKWNVLTSSNGDAKWVSEIVHTNPMWINQEVAESLGLRKGDRVRVNSPLGSLVVEIRPTQGIHPKVVAISGHLGHWGMGRIAQAKRFPSDHPDTTLLWWNDHGNGTNPNSLMPVMLAAVGGGQAFHDTVVSLARV
jgi:anaerobic selenocysteine-containing dehydrogenase